MAVTDFSGVGVSKKRLLQTAKRLIPELKRLQKANYQSPYASVCVPSDSAILHVVRAAVAIKRNLNPKLIVIVGIGGSNLGAMAVSEALFAKWRAPNAPRVCWADTVDPDATAHIVEEMQNVLRSGGQVLINVISKSGSTLETIANFEVLLNVLRRHRRNAEDFVVVTTDKGSALWDFALHKRYSLLEIPKSVGGRYSVFTPVGLFPLGMLGVDIAELVGGAKDALAKSLSLKVEKNPAALAAAALFLHAKAKRDIHDTFVFAKNLEGVGKWYRQLLAESVGKEFDKKGKRVQVGITPTVSVGSIDLHSVGQLYLAGPNCRITHFVTSRFAKDVALPSYPEFNRLVPGIQKREFRDLMRAIAQGTMASYKKKGLPYFWTRLEGATARELGFFLQQKMIETMLLASLFNVNAFDQPNVESYKQEARRILSR